MFFGGLRDKLEEWLLTLLRVVVVGGCQEGLRVEIADVTNVRQTDPHVADTRDVFHIFFRVEGPGEGLRIGH